MALIRTGQWVTVHHLKPWRRGEPVEMRGMCTAYDGNFLRLHRLFQSPGRRYDGIRTCQERGDWGTIELVRGSWIARRRYFSADGTLKGELYNVQTPTSFHDGHVRYVDLEIDVALCHQGGRLVEVQDEDDLERAVRAGNIRSDLAETARRIAYELAERLTDARSLEHFLWDVRPADVGVLPVHAREGDGAGMGLN